MTRIRREWNGISWCCFFLIFLWTTRALSANDYNYFDESKDAAPHQSDYSLGIDLLPRDVERENVHHVHKRHLLSSQVEQQTLSPEDEAVSPSDLSEPTVLDTTTESILKHQDTSIRLDEDVDLTNNVSNGKRIINKMLVESNITTLKKVYHLYYNSTILTDPTVAQHHYWVDLNNRSDAIVSQLLSNSYRKASTVKLSFDFPFYGHPIRNVTIATGGFLYTGDIIHSWLAATQYVAPLMANFDNTISHKSSIRYLDNGTSFTVEWTNVLLQNGPEKGDFTFQVTLYENGDIVFVYKKVPYPIKDMGNVHHPVKIGLSDAYYTTNKHVHFVHRKTINEYHRINFILEDIKNWTVIYLEALPTCLAHKDCSSCLLDPSVSKLDCSWCPSLRRCSSGIDRGRDEWLTHGCLKTLVNNETQCGQKDVFRKDHKDDVRSHPKVNDDSKNNTTNIPPGGHSPNKNITILLIHNDGNNTYDTISNNGHAEISQNQTGNRSEEGVSGTGNVDKDERYMSKTLDESDITIVKEDYHLYYNSTILIDNTHHCYWVDLDNRSVIIGRNKLSNSYRKTKTVELSFDFPIYGHLIKNVTIATGGFLYTGDFIHSWLAATQYVAPLMANFDIISNESLVRYMDNGTAFTVEWTRVSLRDRPKEEGFTFQVTLYRNGDIVFVYKEVPFSIRDIDASHHPVKVGLSDAYVVNRTAFFTVRKTIYEYHLVSFIQEDIKNGTVIYLKALRTCLVHKDCSNCLLDSSVAKLNCTWCPSLKRCSNGIDRGREKWLKHGCDVNNITQCGQERVFHENPKDDEHYHRKVHEDSEITSTFVRHADDHDDHRGHSADKNITIPTIHNGYDNHPDSHNVSGSTTESVQDVTPSNRSEMDVEKHHERTNDTIMQNKPAVPAIFAIASDKNTTIRLIYNDENNNTYGNITDNGTAEDGRNQTSTPSQEDVNSADNVDTDKEYNMNTLDKRNITIVKQDYHRYYNSTILIDNAHHYYWVDLDDRSVVIKLSSSYRRAKTVQLSFDFPIYGHLIKNVTIATGGFLYTGDFIHSWLAATQYVAPLMANFDTISNESSVRYMDNGTAFTAEWTKVSLQDRPKQEEFTFQVTLYKNGDIVFVYKEVPFSIKDINDSRHPVKVGLSDAYVIERIVYYIRRKTLYEYYRINFVEEDIKNGTVIYLKALPTCLAHKDCSSCLLDSSVEKLNCSWCPSLKRCSNGIDRDRDKWLTSQCDKTNIRNETQCGQQDVLNNPHKDNVHPHPKIHDDNENIRKNMLGDVINDRQSPGRNFTIPPTHNEENNNTDSDSSTVSEDITETTGSDQNHTTTSNPCGVDSDEHKECITTESGDLE